MSRPLLGTLAFCIGILTGVPAPAIVPPGFVDEVAVSGLSLPVAVRPDAGGRLYVAEKAGVVRLAEADGTLLPTPVVDLTDEIHAQHDKGLLDVALDPNFDVNGYLYLTYMVDPIFGEPDEHAESATWGRVTRYTVVADTVDTSSRLVLLGNTAADGIAHCHRSHAIGTIRFGTDGSLFVGAGDGAHYDFIDGGQDVTSFDPECAALFGAVQDVGALRAQITPTLAGKILRIDPATGLGYPSNPWWDGDANSFESRHWARGLRNPFRFEVRPGTPAPGTLYIGDVGASAYEEINVSLGGENFGWPCFEGDDENWSYQNAAETMAFCSGVSSGSVTDPAWAWSHSDPGTLGFIGNATSGGTFYTGTSFPSVYHDRFFFADYGDNWIWTVVLDSANVPQTFDEFATGLLQPVDLAVDPPTGDLLYVSITSGEVRRVRWVADDEAPNVVISANPTSGITPLDVQFSSDGTIDPNGDPFTLSWDFGDGSPLSSVPNPMHTFTTIGTFDVWCTAVDSAGNADSAMVTVNTINQPPTAAITSPTSGYLFDVPEMILLTGNASDPEDGTSLTWAWTVDLIHNDHPHPSWHTAATPNSSFQTEPHGSFGDRYSYRICLTVYDSQGASAADTTWILPLDQGANAAPVADFTATPQTGVAPLVVQFDAGPTVDPDDDYLFYEWDFGDGTTGTGAAPSHIYGAGGLYTVQLTVQDPALATGVATAVVRADPPGVIADWPLNEGSGSSAGDSSGSGHHGTIVGAAWVPGKSGTALDFNGVDQSVNTGVSFLSDLPQFTLAAWVKPESISNRTGILGQNNCIEFGFYTPTDLAVWSPTGGSVGASYTFPMGEWHHVAATGDGNQVKLWIDGAPQDSAAQFTENYGTSGDPVRFGGGGIWDASGNWFDGCIDSPRVYARALTEAEIQLLAYDAPPNTAPVPDAGPDLDAHITLPAGLLAAVADDGLPAPPGQVSVTWTQASGPAASSIFAPTSLFTQATFPVVGTYEIELLADDGLATAADTVLVTVTDPTGVLPGEMAVAAGLRSVAPNPARGNATILYGVPRVGADVRLRVHAVDGRLVRTLVARPAATAGSREVRWDGRDDAGHAVTSGVYFVVADIDGRRSTRKLTLLK